MLSSEGTDLKNSFEFWEFLEDLLEVTFMKRIDLADWVGTGYVLVLILQLENEADVAEVAACF